MTENELREMIKAYLDNGDFVSEYAQYEFAGLTAMLAQDWPPERLEESLARDVLDSSDFDGLGTYAYELAKGMDLEPGHDYRP